MGRRVYDSAAWRYLRGVVLAESAQRSETGSPVCAMCGDRATAVDHRVPVSERPDLAFERSNLRPICRKCNSSRSAKRRAELARHAIIGEVVYPPQREW